MQIKANKDRVVIVKDKVKERTDSGLYIPNADKQSTNTGVVVTSGTRSEGFEDIALDGSKIIYFPSRNMHDIDVNGETYTVIHIEDVIVEIP